ncbi:MAG: tetratricopeptide repeat protein, partial [Actinomycetota bacterium]
FWQTSETIFRQTLAVTDGNYLISHNLCHFLTFKDRLDEAEPFCRAAIADNPDYFETYNTLGVLQIKRGQFAEAEKNFHETLLRSPNYAAAYSNLALAQLYQGKPEEAETSLQKASQLNNGEISPPTFVTALNDLAAVFAKQEKFEKASENFGRALYLAPDRADIRADYALTLAMLKRSDEAQKQIEEAIRQNPNLFTAYNVQGLIYLEQNKKDEAIRQFEKALELKPDFTEAIGNLKRAKGEK